MVDEQTNYPYINTRFKRSTEVLCTLSRGISPADTVGSYFFPLSPMEVYYEKLAEANSPLEQKEELSLFEKIISYYPS